MSIVAEAAISAFFDLLFYKLSSTDLLKIFRQENVDADLKKWAMKLRKIRAVLADAEEKQMTDEFVKGWLAELQDLAYDADDILDEFATEALQRELNAEEPSTSTVIKFFNDCVGSDRDFVKQMRSKIEDVDRRLQIIVEEKKDLELRENTGRRTITKTSRPPSTSLVDESRTYGRDEDKKQIVKLLLESSDAQLSVIPIVGMGGLGKTTLAQLVYKDDEVSRHFELKAWVCVSEDFDNLRLTKEILHSFTSESREDNSTLNSLQGKLKNTLSEKKFLLILDDVWNENYEFWTELCKPFEFGALGSKIVVTTRNDGVSSIVRTTPPYKLKELSRDACLRVFTHHALGKPDFSEYPELEELGQKIVDRCKGAPLAAKVLGGLLRTKHDPYEWKSVLNSKIWDIPEEKGSIFFGLKLSYNFLPSHLKRCFAYCSLFPKNYYFQEKELVLLWMAEGLVQETKEKPMEDLGGEYFRDLLNRSFFQQQSSRHESFFVMHDLLHDLAQWAAGNLCCRLEDQLGGSKQFEISTKVRHFSQFTYSNDCIIYVEDFLKDMHLRTFLLVSFNWRSKLSNFDAICLLPQLRCLRVLSLLGNEIFELPSSIGDLKHLRYLNLSYAKIKILPESTSSLYNLQTLILKYCDRLTKLPEKIENLVNLRHLDITNANSIIEMPVGIAKLKSLRTLSNFVVGKDKIVDLMNLESLQGTLCISHLENMLDANDARKVNLKGKENLDTLVMKWNDDLQDAGVAIDILDMLRPHGTMKTLSIEGYVGAKFPTWLGDPSFSNMVDLRIERCGKCMFLPAFGQLPSLKRLIIKRMDGVRSVGLEFYGEREQPFRSLVKLCFEDMHEWQDWSPCNQDFPCLHELSISNCPKLQGKLPHHLPSLEKLSIYACEHLVVSIPSNLELQEVKIVGCKEVVHGSLKVEKLIIENCEELTSLCEDGLMSFVTLEIEIKSCQSLVNIKLKSTLRKLTIKGCNALESLQFVMDEGGASSTSSLSMNEEKIEIESCQSLVNIKLKSTLKELTIKGCNALESLQFLMDECEELSCLRELSISNCPKLEGKFHHHLPSLEKLSIDACEQLVVSIPSHSVLQVLKIVGCKEVVHGSVKVEKLIIEDCKELTSLCEDELMSFVTLEIEIKSCQSLVNIKLKSTLRKLTIKGCNALESLQFVMDECEEFSCLRELSISNCPKLEGKFSHHLPSLEKLSFDACEQLVVSIPSHSVLQVLKIVGCKDVLVDGFVKAEKLIIRYCEEVTSLSLLALDIIIESCQSLVNVKLKSTLRTLTIDRCVALESLEFVIDEGGASSTSSLLMNVENFCFIGNNNAYLLEHLKISDRYFLRLVGCPKHELNKDTLLDQLLIHHCGKLRCLPRELHELCHLKKISLYKCNSLISLGDLLPTNLRSLEIRCCEKLEDLPNTMHNLNFLQDLSIRDCPSIVSFPEEGFPTNLRELRFSGVNLCKQVFELGLHRLTSLTYLSIGDGIMDSFPEEEAGKTMMMLPTSLTTLEFYIFPNLLFLSWKFFQNLSALEEISFYLCPKLVSLSEKCFPPSLQRLKIFYCPVLKLNCEKDKGIMWSKIAKIPSVIFDSMW